MPKIKKQRVVGHYDNGSLRKLLKKSYLKVLSGLIVSERQKGKSPTSGARTASVLFSYCQGLFPGETWRGHNPEKAHTSGLAQAGGDTERALHH